MTQEEAARITNACDIICENCERKHDASVCDECIVTEISHNAVEQCIDEGCPDESFYDDDNTVYPDPSEDVWGSML